MVETKDLILKQGEQKDWKDMYYNLWCHRESAKYMLWNVTTSEKDAQLRMEKTIAFQKTHPYAWLVYEKKSGQAIGFAGMTMLEDGVYEDTGIAIGPTFVNQGYGKQIVNAMTDYARDELSARRFVLSYREGNIASQKLAEACGFHDSHSEEKNDFRNGERYTLKYVYKDLE